MTGAITLALLLLAAAAPLHAQSAAAAPVTLRGHLDAGSEEEEYVRNLQLAGVVAPFPWSVRPIPVGRATRIGPDTSHPWRERLELGSAAPGGRYLVVLPTGTLATYNSAFPFGANDAAVWAGRGGTVAATAGIGGGFGPLTFALRPVAFWAQNAAFAMQPTGLAGRLVYADPEFPTQIDQPQRFGDKGYGRVDPGQSWVKLDAGPLSVGASTANEWWGPSSAYPLLLGNNAPGFLHAFAGTSRPLNVGVGAVHGRFIWGRLEQSEYSPVAGSRYFVDADQPGTTRFATGLAAVFLPRFAGGLEIGVARFFHSIWPESGLPARYFSKPFESLYKFSLSQRGIPGYADSLGGEDNQLLSVFIRWALPRSHAEFYAEYGREDHAAYLNDLIEEPDHSRMFNFGMRKLFRVRDGSFSVLRAEVFNDQLPITAYHRGEGGTYTHTLMRQGHTHRGQVLGAPVGVGEGAAFLLGLDRYSQRGRRTLTVRRELRKESGDFHETGVQPSDTQDVLASLGYQELRFLRAFDLRYGITLSQELNRNFAGDRFNLTLETGISFRGR